MCPYQTNINTSCHPEQPMYLFHLILVQFRESTRESNCYRLLGQIRQTTEVV